MVSIHKKFVAPKPFHIYVTVTLRKADGTWDEPVTLRNSTANTLAEAHRQIVENEASCKSTYGGLIESEKPGTCKREYSVFKAEWTKVPLDDVLKAR